MPIVVEMTPQGGGFRNDSIAPGAGIDATKLIHQQVISERIVESTTTITASTKPIHIVNAETAEIVDFDAAIFVIASDASRTVSVDLQKSTAGGAFATIMTTPIEFNTTTAVRTAFSGVISDIDLLEGDILQVVTTVAGGIGNQAQGLLVTLTIRERPTS
jgi:hypothetical protein